MEKLVKLLNEYIEKNINTPNRCIGYSCSYFGFDGGTDVIEDTIISKRYGFIQWLVDNDKIDFYTILKENGTFRKEFYAIENKKEYERLIMLLAIQDEPIEFLISILK